MNLRVVDMGKVEIYFGVMATRKRTGRVRQTIKYSIGNTLMGQACDKRIVEVTPSGEIVMDFHIGGPGRLFRVYKFAPDDPAIKALGL